jgi:hypothetical protein
VIFKKDVFPLKIGNLWEYDYDRSSDIDRLSPYAQSSSDSGHITYSIVDSLQMEDTTRWKIKLARFLHHSTQGELDTNYWIIDTSCFSLYEVHSGDHQLIADDNPLWIFPRYYIQMFRYQIVDSLGYVECNICPPPISIPCYGITFHKDTGITRISYFYASNTWYYHLYAPLTKSILTEVFTSSIANASIVKPFLSQNYPNPFNPSTTISYQLLAISYVTLRVYDVLGREIETIVNGKQNAGTYSARFNGNKLPSGIYFYRLISGDRSETKKMLLVR